MPYVGSLLTPDTPLPADAVVYRAFNNVPVEWQSLIDGILSAFTDGKFWIADGALTADESAGQLDELVVRWMLSDLCEAIADCISTSTATQTAITNYLANNQYGGDYGRGVNAALSPDDVNNLLAGVACSNDTLFAIATGIVDYLHATMLDILEKLELTTSALELLAIAGDIFPVLGDAPALLNWMHQQVRDSYDAGYTLALRDEVRCDLFCLMADACDLTYSDLLSYVVLKAGIEFVSTDSLADLVNEIVGISDPEFVVYGCWTLVLGTNSIMARFGGSISAQSFETAVSLLANDTDPDWSLLCSCAGTWATQILGGGGLPLSGYTIVQGNYNAIDDRIDGVWDGIAWRCDFTISLASSAQLTRIIVIFEYDQTVSGGTTVGFLDYNNSGTYVAPPELQKVISIAELSTYTADTANIDVPFNFIEAGSNARGTAGTGYARIKSVSIYGTGTKPPEFN